MIIVVITIIFISIYLSLYIAYYLLMFFIHFIIPVHSLRSKEKTTHFLVIIPAHDEELLLPRLLASIQKQYYSQELIRTIVVADNCTDNTAEVARQHGATVLERFQLKNKGKGYAIKWALEMGNIDQYDAVLIVDADCIMNPTTLKCLDAVMEGKQIIQCHISVSNPDDSWFTRLLDVSRTIENEIYFPTKQRLGLSTHLVGTGMCFTTKTLMKYGWDSFTVGEDWEYYVKLLLQGETIGFAYDAKVYQIESSSLKQATSQRMRWSSGRFAIAWKYGFRLLARGIVERNIVKCDAAVPLIFPNPSLGINITLIGLVTVLALPTTHKNFFTVWFLSLGLIQLGIFIVGVFYTQKKLSKFLSIFIAPVFLFWKMVIDIFSVLGIGRKKWVRTERKP